jgi:RNA polymerase subunit RPABC4/transcription elongation factor Spt4
MIPITLSWFVCLYLALFLAGILLLWIGYEVIRKHHDKLMARDRIFCRVCGSRYTDTTTQDLVHCPVCQSLNERDGR